MKKTLPKRNTFFQSVRELFSFILTEDMVLVTSEDMAKSIAHFMKMVQMVVVFLVTLPVNFVLFIITHALLLGVSVMRDSLLLWIRFRQDFRQQGGTGI